MRHNHANEEELIMQTLGAGFFVGAGIPKGERVNTFAECGCCGAYHRTDFAGDCREDSERHYDLPNDAIIIEDFD